MESNKTTKTIKKTVKKDSLHAVGRRKTAKCTVSVSRGEGVYTVNGKKLEEYFPLSSQKITIFSAFVATNTLGDFNFSAKVSGGGINGQADSLRLAIARSLSKLNEEYHSILSKKNLLTRDPRAKERKKVFFVRARKKPQFSKR